MALRSALRYDGLMSRRDPLTLASLAQVCREMVAAEPRMMAVYLFGSRAKGEARPDSDVDLAVLFAEPVGLGDLVALENGFEERLGAPVDLINVGTCDPFLALEAIRGERLYCADPVRCDEFDLYVLRRAGDLEPFERERRAMLLGVRPAEARRAS
jgi:predicted nucleotidyltransferase